MFLLVTGLCIFLGVHLIPAKPKVRARLVARLGENKYRAIFSLISFTGFMMIALGVALGRGSPSDPQLWVPPLWTRHLAFALMLPAFILLVAAHVPSRIRTLSRHPMLVSVKIWALAHLLSNGDLLGLILFGAFLAYSVFDRISLKKRHASGPPGHRHGGPLNDVFVIVLGTALYVVMLFWGHQWLIGIPLLASPS